MNRFYVFKNANLQGKHELHKDGCRCVLNDDMAIYLGSYNSISIAIVAARAFFNEVVACAYCCEEIIANNA
jgi:hypothetical protein